VIHSVHMSSITNSGSIVHTQTGDYSWWSMGLRSRVESEGCGSPKDSSRAIPRSHGKQKGFENLGHNHDAEEYPEALHEQCPHSSIHDSPDGATRCRRPNRTMQLNRFRRFAGAHQEVCFIQGQSGFILSE